MAQGDVVIRDPRALRALAHPTRLAILERLQGEGPATATEIGELLGISPSAASYHLRALGRFGLVEDAGGGTGRNRPWRGVGTGFMFEPSLDMGQAAETAAQLLGAQLIERGEREALAFVAAESGLDPEWRAASHVANKTIRLTAAEAVELVRRLEEVIAPYARSARREPPPGAKTVRLLLRLFPRERQET